MKGCWKHSATQQTSTASSPGPRPQSYTPLNIFYQGWNTLANTGPDGQPILTAADLAPLHAAVVSACDALDGTKDGLIADPFACHWNPRAIQCAAGQLSTSARFCLTAAQVATVNKLYDGPTTSTGQLLYPGWELRGSEETGWAGSPGERPESPRSTGASPRRPSST